MREVHTCTASCVPVRFPHINIEFRPIKVGRPNIVLPTPGIPGLTAPMPGVPQLPTSVQAGIPGAGITGLPAVGPGLTGLPVGGLPGASGVPGVPNVSALQTAALQNLLLSGTLIYKSGKCVHCVPCALSVHNLIVQSVCWGGGGG